ncbi:hypothetical protein LCM17_02875 [Cereibacter sphaeroides]|nr:hypothetical protein [Cereibacter sphaeroides]
MPLLWDAEAIDALTETVITRLLVRGDTARAVAMDLALGLSAAQPTLPALALALPFTLAASAIEEMLGAGAPARAAALDAWRIAALIGADALMLKTEGDDSLAALAAQWKAGDEVFDAGS